MNKIRTIVLVIFYISFVGVIFSTFMMHHYANEMKRQLKHEMKINSLR